MRVTYLGPLIAGLQHPALHGYDLSHFSPSCFLVEVKEGAGLDGPLIEGDMLVVDEGRTPQHNDLVIALVEEEQCLFHAFRIGGSLLLIPPRGRDGAVPARWVDLRGVVVSQARRYVH
ncbi:LexA family protein [Modicisalibacter xianhensis]|uniref:DNA polymerase V n=1 Tax=Modicisalibacter xianhensis TaxID=442341 RepID=A0A1I2ZBI6_9GAMM|nr:hypothetical protein [Halomonas xianhensis]SFH34975.1 hypothetical protein SAMN04487959_1036 [Halomonas xianhensis]